MRLWRVHIKTYYFGIRYHITYANVLYGSYNIQFFDIYGYIPCWSLTGLLSVLPKGTDIIKEEADTKKNEHYMCTVGIKDNIMSTFGNNPVDACYEIILKLHELKLL